jgi:hypothetical protein
VLLKKGWVGPNIFHLCQQAEETIQHIFFNCAFPCIVWATIIAALKLTFTWDGHSLAACFDNWSKIAHHSLNLPPMVCWYIWIDRNNIFANKSPSAISVAFKSLGIHNFWSSINPRTVIIKTKHHTISQVEFPTTWFDGASQSNNMQSSAGGVIHISQNTLCRRTFNCGQGTNTRVELLAAWASLLLTSRLNL